ncbi:NapC/NirT family cytochrome c [Carboxylicivirga sp. M1479]|uniref:NapC/NirT family cytochrome c n=1 Tax=Carboxylicivirga sp. M1479 TaxID=2594476 RepID=UPI00117857C0|nr:NapC/NirT family cytochrome c [Carboxylicivirga sp. M1479]TRX66486.1 SUMF1/EgtB/PvdOfamily nonheme iron enzyme [Carboxylicivirga sp. M1479]
MIKRLTQLTLLLGSCILIAFLFKTGDAYTSSNDYCNSCHVHDHALYSWHQSIHSKPNNNKLVTCIECHLPPKGHGFYQAKIKAGWRDLYAYYLKDSSTYNWQQKSQIEHAKIHTFKASCTNCHTKLFPDSLSSNGELAHWHYVRNKDEMHCIQCHLNVGHGNYSKTTHNLSILNKKAPKDTIYIKAASIQSFDNFTETIPESDVSFKMIAVKNDKLHNNKSSQAFFIGQIEVSWDEYLLFLSETESEGRGENTQVDGISGATPPWGNPDQGWGLGKRPAITMTHHAATTYCQWLSKKTGKNYRLPTAEEWEFAAKLAYPNSKLSEEQINTNKTQTLEPDDIKPDILGTLHLFGNVNEFCADVLENGEYIIKGGSFRNFKEELSPQWKAVTQTEQWLKTDPQIPKSIWWYSDCNEVGFRVVLSFHAE